MAPRPRLADVLRLSPGCDIVDQTLSRANSPNYTQPGLEPRRLLHKRARHMLQAMNSHGSSPSCGLGDSLTVASIAAIFFLLFQWLKNKNCQKYVFTNSLQIVEMHIGDSLLFLQIVYISLQPLVYQLATLAIILATLPQRISSAQVPNKRVSRILIQTPRSSNYLSDFPNEKSDCHTLPDRCRASWECGNELEC